MWEEDGRWVHVHPDGVLVEREVHLASISKLDAMTRDYWLYQYTPKPGDVVVDVGAGSGWETMLFSKLVGATGRVYAIEAHPGTYACLVDMIRRNGLHNVTPVCCAMGEKAGFINISDASDHQGNSIVAGDDNPIGVQIPMRTLEEFCTTAGIQRISFLKMNIEGAEKWAVPGLGRMVRFTDHLVISCHDFRADWGEDASFRSRAEVERWLSGAGVEITTRQDPRPWVRDCVYGVWRGTVAARPANSLVV